MLIKYTFLKKNPMEKNSVKYIISYDGSDYIGPLRIMLPQIIRYVKLFNDNKTMSFGVTDNRLLNKYIKIRERVSNLMNIEFDSKPGMGIMTNTIKLK